MSCALILEPEFNEKFEEVTVVPCSVLNAMR